MKVGLIDVDGHNFPNLALMRISAYHKARGDSVEWWWSDFEYTSRLAEYQMSCMQVQANQNMLAALHAASNTIKGGGR